LKTNLKFLDEKTERDPKSVVEAANQIINSIDKIQLAVTFGVRVDPEDQKQSKLRSEQEKNKEILIDAIFRKGLALSELGGDTKEIDSNFNELKKWSDPEDSKFVMLSAKLYQSQHLYGQALKIINKNLEGLTGDPLEKQLLNLQLKIVEENLKWNHLASYYRQSLLARFPTDFTLF